MKVIARAGNDNIATVYIAESGDGNFIEFVESIQPPVPREEKWVLIVSTLYGCPIGCPICDAGGWFKGGISADDILAQIDYMVTKRFPDRVIPIPKFKVQFARMGEPALNPAVLDVLEILPDIYDAPGLMPCISTIAPTGTDSFFERLTEIKQRLYPDGKFQLQFSIHTTDRKLRDYIIPANKWDFTKIAEFGKRFRQPGDRKIALNFAAAKDYPIDPNVLLVFFDPEIFLLKLTPVNPTKSAIEKNFDSLFVDESDFSAKKIVSAISSKGYDVILSIGELEENKIGSNCGQYIKSFLKSDNTYDRSYSYDIIECR